MLQNSVPRSSPFRSFTFPTTPPPSQQKALSMDSWGRTTMTCVPPLAVRAFIRTLRDKTERSESASTELVYSISRSHSPNHTRSGHTTLSKNLHESDCIAAHRKCTAMPPSKRGHRKQTFIRQSFTFMKASKLFSCSALTAFLIGTVAHADVVTEWNNAALDAIRAGHTPPPIASRSLAILHVSIYDAVNGIARPHEPYLVQSEVPASASREAAASAAAHDALVSLFPASASSFDALHATILATILDGPQKVAGIVWGEFVANQILAARANDGSDATVPPPGGSGPGVWVPTPPAFLPYLLPQWGFVTPFAMSSSSQFRPPGPPPLDSQRYAADYYEVKELGAASGSTRTAEQTEIALFWADGAGTETPPGHWNSIAQIIADARGNTLEQNARLFALLNIAIGDAAICAWYANFDFLFWLPSLYVILVV